MPQLTGTAATHSASPESKLDGIEVSNRTPHFSNQALLCHVDVAQVQGVVNRLHLPHFDEPHTDVFGSCLQNPLAMILSLVQHLSEKQEKDEAKSWTKAQGAPTRQALPTEDERPACCPTPGIGCPMPAVYAVAPTLISSAERLKGFFQGCFLIINLLQLQGQWLFQTTNCAKITGNSFTSTQVKRAERSSATKGFAALRKHTNYTERLVYWREMEKVFPTESVFQLEHIKLRPSQISRVESLRLQGKWGHKAHAAYSSYTAFEFLSKVCFELHCTTPSLQQFLYQISRSNSTLFPFSFWTFY